MVSTRISEVSYEITNTVGILQTALRELIESGPNADVKVCKTLLDAKFHLESAIRAIRRE